MKKTGKILLTVVIILVVLISGIFLYNKTSDCYGHSEVIPADNKCCLGLKDYRLYPTKGIEAGRDVEEREKACIYPWENGEDALWYNKVRDTILH
ncbi:hypothetical protein HQ544_04875 [Candidatus Falkowbacteria bacterium]|nr:hypothetical protein [Candidatus Falkowbacteria bacterium]